MSDAVIVCAKRTAIGKVGGMFKHFPPEKLAAAVMKDVVRESGIGSSQIDDVILGNVVGPGGNIARLSLLEAGFPVDVPGVSVDRQCGSGLEAISYAARLVESGAGDIYLAGGVESSSLAPWKVEKPVSLYQSEPPRMYTKARFSPDTVGDPDMGIAAENVAGKYQISREEQDHYAFLSHQKAVYSMTRGNFQGEITPINKVFIQDECPKSHLSMKILSRARPAFKKGGTVTSGNSCQVNDGAAVALVMSREKAKSLRLRPVLEMIDSVTVGVDPNFAGIGPVLAVKKLLESNKLNGDDIDIVEFNEAFASQVIASLKELHISLEKVNVGGGAIALGHPYGASGAILVTRLFTEMKKRDVRFGLATMGIGGGMGSVVLFRKHMNEGDDDES
jgi:acetyl-CoA C-acetyltransferase